MKHRKKNILTGIILLSIVIVVIGYPLFFILVNSFKTNNEILITPSALPKIIHWENYIEAFNNISILRLFFNSIVICAISVVGILIVSSLASFIFGKLQTKNILRFYKLILLGLLIPVNAIIIPLYKLIQTLNLLDTHVGISLAYIAINLPFAVFVLTNYIKTIPDSLIEAAVIDGASIYKIWFFVVFPLQKAVLATLSIIISINVWNDFLFPVIFLSRENMRTIPLGIMSFFGQYGTQFNHVYPSIIMSILPMIILYIVLSKKIISGVTSGAIK